MSTQKSDQKTERFVQTIIEHLELPVPVTLWNGRVLGGDTDFDKDKTMHVRVASPEAVRTIVRRPSIDSLVELWTSKQIDIVNGTVFDIAAIEKRTGIKNRRTNIR